MTKIPSPDSEGVALYIHWPFCEKKCSYCDFVSGPQFKNQEEPYLKALLSELQSYQPFAIKTLFIGGGTPSLIPLETLDKIFEALQPIFALHKPSELSIEGNPGSLKEANLRHYLELGFNRISIGIQSFSDPLLERLGRIHTRKEAIEGFHLAKKAGFKNISLDLMFGIPGQTLADFRESLEIAAQLDPEHISAYSLILEPETPFFELHQQGKLALPEEHQVAEMFLLAQEFLKQHGYQHYEISNFAKEGYQCRHNLVYWNNEPYVGLGLNAHSYYGDKRYNNSANMEEYLKAPTAIADKWQTLPKLPLDEDISNFMILGLRKMEGVRFADFNKRYGDDLRVVFADEIKELSLQGLVELDDTSLRLTSKGILLGNEVFEKFL